jgi:hypothetical protein
MSASAPARGSSASAPAKALPRGFEPAIIIDSREQSPLVFPKLQAIRGTLVTEIILW